MSEQTMKILQMLEDGKITAEQANELLSQVRELEEREKTPRGPVGGVGPMGPVGSVGPTGPMPYPGPGIHIPEINIPPIPDVGEIVNNALKNAFDEGFPGHAGRDVRGAVVFKGARFEGANLEFTDLTGATFDKKTRFESANLSFASFAGADLRGADLRMADLSYSNFGDADLRGSDLREANLSMGNYEDSDFRNCDLRGADLSMSQLADADFRGVKEPGLILRGVLMEGIRYRTGEFGQAPEHDECYEEAARQAEEAAEQAKAAAEEY